MDLCTYENIHTMWGAVAGLRSSSLRTELAAGCIAATAPGPIHQATDFMAYKAKANRILQGQNLTAKRPWGLQQDGDLSEMLQHIVDSRGRETSF